MNLDLLKPTDRELKATAALFAKDDPRRGQIMSYCEMKPVSAISEQETAPISQCAEAVAGPKFNTLKKNKKNLTDEERVEVMKAKAVWHHGPKGEETPAVWKAVVDGDTWYVTHTHRAYNTAKTLKGAISRYHKFIKTTAMHYETDNHFAGAEQKVSSHDEMLDLFKKYQPEVDPNDIADVEGMCSVEGDEFLEAVKKAKVIDLPLTDLRNIRLCHGDDESEYATQHSDKPIVVVKHGEQLHVLDGQNRFNKAVRAKQPSIRALIIKGLEKYKNEMSAPHPATKFHQ